MNGRGHRRDYGWDEARVELATGTHPEVVAARLGEPIDYLLEVAGERAWPITWQHSIPNPETMLSRYSALYGFDA